MDTAPKVIGTTEAADSHHADCRFISGSGWLCATACGRPMIAMAGRVTAAFTHGLDAEKVVVEIWVQSPTGGESDSQIFQIECLNIQQADIIARQWNARWAL